MTSTEDIDRYLANLKEERSSAALYRIMAEHEKNDQMAKIFLRLAETEEVHAEAWAKRLTDAGVTVPLFRLSGRTRILMWLVRRFGVDVVVPTLSKMEVKGAKGYRTQPEALDMVAAEQSHARLLQQIGRTSSTGMAGSTLARLEGRHRAAGGNALRAAVLGASDGLLSNFNLVMGVAGAELTSTNILLTGFAGLLAGAISMALGEWISVQSSRELYQKQIDIEKDEIADAPGEEVEELVLIYQARGMDETSARRLATKLMSSPEIAIEALARDELGIDPEELGGSAWEAAITSFLLFGAGAMIPVLPFLAFQGSAAVAASVALSTIGLFTDRFGHHPFHRQVDPLFRRAACALRACSSGRRF